MKRKKIELVIERGLFASRWLMAPFYVGLVGALVILLATFMQELYHCMANIFHSNSKDAVLGIISLIDLSLAGNLVLIVIFSGYENFVSKMDLSNHEDKPDWHGSVDFSGLKLKLMASIVAISGIHLLKIFMDIESLSESKIKWLVIIHVVFVISGVLLAFMDMISANAKSVKSYKKSK